MFCVIQEIQRRKLNQHGAQKVLEVYSPYSIEGKGPKYAYRYTGGTFERPIRTAYKVSIHESKRIDGVVTKRQFPVTTVGYCDLAEFWLGDCFLEKRLDPIAASLNVSVESLWELINAKVNPLEERIKAEFQKTPEYKTHVKHEKILREYNRMKQAFSKGYGVDANEYDYCYNVYGEVMNQSYIDEIMRATRQRDQSSSSYHSSGYSNYTSYDYSKLLGSSSTFYTDEDKEHLKKFYRSLSKIYHPDMNRDTDTQAEMVLLNKLKDEWGI